MTKEVAIAVAVYVTGMKTREEDKRRQERKTREEDEEKDREEDEEVVAMLAGKGVSRRGQEGVNCQAVIQ